MPELTEEQIKELWEWCGFKIEKIPDETPFYVLYEPNRDRPRIRGEQYNIWYSNYRGEKPPVDELYPDIDLNSLFKYAWDVAVDKLTEENGGNKSLAKWDLIIRWTEQWDIIKDPALALFWAIYKVKKEKTNNATIR